MVLAPFSSPVFSQDLPLSPPHPSLSKNANVKKKKKIKEKGIRIEKRKKINPPRMVQPWGWNSA